MLVFVPYEYFEIIGINFLPDKYWLLAVPIHFYVTLVFIYLMVNAWNLYTTNEIPAKEGKIECLILKMLFINLCLIKK